MPRAFMVKKKKTKTNTKKEKDKDKDKKKKKKDKEKKKNAKLGMEIWNEVRTDLVKIKYGVRKIITTTCVTHVHKDF